MWIDSNCVFISTVLPSMLLERLSCKAVPLSKPVWTFSTGSIWGNSWLPCISVMWIDSNCVLISTVNKILSCKSVSSSLSSSACCASGMALWSFVVIYNPSADKHNKHNKHNKHTNNAISAVEPCAVKYKKGSYCIFQEICLPVALKPCKGYFLHGLLIWPAGWGEFMEVNIRLKYGNRLKPLELLRLAI